MTKTQIKKALEVAKIHARVTGTGRNIEVELQNESDMQKFCSKIANWGGYRTGWGGWVLRPGYQPSGDWNDRTSRHHY